MVSREVNVNRPEHSWIPFYRELAEKLVKDRWREKQGELVGMLQRLKESGIPIHSIADNLMDHVDPFTIFALFSRGISFDNMLRVMDALKSELEISTSLPKEQPFIPYANNMSIGYFWGFDDIEDEIETIWDIFETVTSIDSFDEISTDKSLVELIEAGLQIKGVRISKLTSAFYWVNPYYLLHSATVNAVGGADLGIKATDTSNKAADADSYLKCLVRTAELTERSFPETNIAVFKSENPDWAPPKVWIVRGGRGAVAVEEFRTGGYTGFGFGFEDHDISKYHTDEQLERLCEERDLRGSGIDQVIPLLTEIKIGDYVLMPGPGSVVNHYGRVVSDPYHSPSGTHNNRRDVEWSENKISQSQLDLSGYQHTVTRPNQDVQNRFLEIIEGGSESVDFKMPEDSWVPFHLEVGRKLIEGEWWSEEKRSELEERIDVIRWADPEDVGEDYEYDRWPGDPFSFYLSFNMRSMGSLRVPGYRKVKELFMLDAEVPDASHVAAGYGVHGAFGRRPSSPEIETLWEFFRLAYESDPVDDSGIADEFAEYFDRLVVPDDFVGLRNRKLSYWLHWVDPTRYVYIEQLNKLGILTELGLGEDGDNGHGYLKALAKAREMAMTNGLKLLDLGRWGATRETLGIATECLNRPAPYRIDEVIKDGVFLNRGELERMMRILRSKKNLILQGPPGVGKTFIARKLAYVLMGEKGEGAEKRITGVQFHQSYSYEDFVGGFRPDVKDERMVFKPQDGPFLDMCAEAQANPDDAHVMLIDEINRGNLSRVFGELLMLIEADKRKEEHGVTLQHQPERYHSFFVPKNVYIIGTMNLADKSLTGMNVAMRRRFGFYDLEPQFGEPVFKDWLSKTEMPQEMQVRINSNMSKLNTTISKDDSLDFNYAVGHSFFCPPQNEPVNDWDAWYETVVDYEIRPLLREYWFDDPERANDESDKLKKRME